MNEQEIDARLLNPPFTLRARLLTPLDSGGTAYLADGRLEVGEDGRIVDVGDWSAVGSTPPATESSTCDRCCCCPGW